MKRFIYSLPILLLLLAGCNSTPKATHARVAADPFNLIVEDKFPNAKNITIESQEEIFALSEEMKRVVKDKFASENIKYKKTKKLVQHIFESSNVGLAYQSNANLTAAQTYEQKVANCMSLTILTYVLAKEAGLEASFQDVQVPEYWIRNGQYNMLTGHVNLLIHGVREPGVNVIWGSTNLEVDFDPFIRKKSFPKKTIDVNTVVAMFYNNKGAQALVNNNYDLAFKYFSAAVKKAPNYGASWGNLGILYRFTEQHTLAEQVYRHTMAVEPDNLNTLTNLGMLLERQGRFEESRTIDSTILKQRIKNPYYHALLADEAFYKGNPESAIRHYNRAIKLNSKIHEFYYGLAKVLSSVGNKDSAKIAMRKALRNNRTPDIEQLYIAKLDLLNR